MDDILDNCEIWNKDYAKAILKNLAEVFDDMDHLDFYFEESMVEEEIDSSFESSNALWDEMRNDSSLVGLF